MIKILITGVIFIMIIVICIIPLSDEVSNPLLVFIFLLRHLTTFGFQNKLSLLRYFFFQNPVYHQRKGFQMPFKYTPLPINKSEKDVEVEMDETEIPYALLYSRGSV